MKPTFTALLVAATLLFACPGEGKPPPPPAPAATKVEPPPAPPAVTDITAENYPMPRLPKAKVTVAGAKKLVVDAEVALTRDARTRGLMWRYALPDGTGMLFIFTREQPLSFWMRNTLIPLDIIFIDGKGKIVSIQENAEPRTLTSRPAAAPATYVLEVPGGWSAKNGVKAGAAVTFEGITNLVAED